MFRQSRDNVIPVRGTRHKAQAEIVPDDGLWQLKTGKYSDREKPARKTCQVLTYEGNIKRLAMQAKP